MVNLMLVPQESNQVLRTMKPVIKKVEQQHVQGPRRDLLQYVLIVKHIEVSEMPAPDFVNRHDRKNRDCWP
jgi:hypothetical protein